MGCSENKTSMEYFLDHDYVSNGEEGGYEVIEKQLSEKETIMLGYKDEEFKYFETWYYGEGFTVTMYSGLEASECKASVYIREKFEYIDVTCADAVAFYDDNTHYIDEELDYIIANFKLNAKELEGGDLTVIPELLGEL